MVKMSGSALYGEPPNTPSDLLIVKAMLSLAGMPDADPTKGVPLPPHRPANYHFETRGSQLVVSMTCLIVLVFVITGIRLALRMFVSNLKFGADDVMIIPAALAVVLWLALVIVIESIGGGGKHQFDSTYMEIYWMYRITAVCTIIFFVSTILTKISILLFNKRLTGLTSRRWTMAQNVLIVLLIMFLIASILVLVFQTNPAEASFSLIYLGGLSEPPKSLSYFKSILGLSVTNTIFDFALLSMPIIVLWKIRMSTVKKVGLFFIFSIGGLSCISSVMRILAQAHFYDDPSWTFTKTITWAVLEMFFGVIVASLPTFNSLFILIHRRLKKNTSRSRSSYSTATGSKQVTSNWDPESSVGGESIQRKDEVKLEYHSRKTSDGDGMRESQMPWAAIETMPHRPSHQVDVSSNLPSPQ